MKILVLSDTHGEIAAAERIFRREKPDQVIHLGDHLRDAEDLERIFPYLPICAVPGNNDFFSDQPKEKTLIFGRTRIFLCHGHTANVKYGTDLLIAKARKENATVALFGHTHVPYSEEENGILLLNPGSLTYKGTYATITLSAEEPPQAEIKYE